MGKLALTYQDFDLKNDPDSLRFFICSAFEIFYKLEKKGTVIKFTFLNIGSYFISILLDTLAQNLIGKNDEDALDEINKAKTVTQNHAYLTPVDKRRFCNFLNRLSELFLINNN